MVVLFAVFSPLIVVRAPVPPTCLQEKIGVTGQAFGKVISILGFAEMPAPLAVAVKVNLCADPREADTAADLPHPALRITFALTNVAPLLGMRKVSESVRPGKPQMVPTSQEEP